MVRFAPLVLKNAFRNRRRSLLTILSLTASFCLLGVLLALYQFFFYTPATPNQALRLIARNRISITNSVPLYYGDRIRKLPGVRAVSAWQWFGGAYKDAREAGNFFARFAVDPEYLFTVLPEVTLPDAERMAFQRDRTGCIVGRRLAARLGFRTGDRISLVGDIFPFTAELTVRGIYESETDAENLYFHYQYLRESLPPSRRDSIGMFVAIADSPAAVPRIAAAVDEMFRNSPHQTLTESEKAFQLSFLQYLGDVQLILLSICGALTFTVLLVSANAMAMSVRERVREIGVLKTLGYTPANVLALVLSESVLLGVLGGGIGLALAGAMVSLLRQIRVPFVNLHPLGMPLPVAAAALLLAAAVGAASAIVPAWNAARRPIVLCLRFTD